MSLREQHDLYMKKIKRIKGLGWNVYVQHEDWRERNSFVDGKGRRHKPKYMTFACVEPVAEAFDGLPSIVQYAFCCPRDTPSRKLGWSIAVGRALKEWEKVYGEIEVE